MCFQEGRERKIRLGELLVEESHFVVRWARGGPNAAAIPHYDLQSGHFGGVEEKWLRGCSRAATGRRKMGSLWSLKCRAARAGERLMVGQTMRAVWSKCLPVSERLLLFYFFVIFRPKTSSFGNGSNFNPLFENYKAMIMSSRVGGIRPHWHQNAPFGICQGRRHKVHLWTWNLVWRLNSIWRTQK